MKMKIAAVTAAVLLATGLGVSPAFAGIGISTPWVGNGISVDAEGATALDSTICDEANTPYVLFVLASSKATNASIKFGSNSAVTMTKVNGDSKGTSAFQYLYSPGDYIDLSTLLAGGVVSIHNGTRKAVLTASHGCVGVPSSEYTVAVSIGENGGVGTSNYTITCGDANCPLSGSVTGFVSYSGSLKTLNKHITVTLPRLYYWYYETSPTVTGGTCAALTSVDGSGNQTLDCTFDGPGSLTLYSMVD